MANEVENTDPLFQLLLCSDLGPDSPEILDQQFADPFVEFFKQVALEDAQKCIVASTLANLQRDNQG